tara:strand:+ start:199 stop:405 length:207 start_codon:yes stop_codon:yes gene_type:complete
MLLRDKEDSLARMLNILGFPVFRIAKKDWRWFDRNFSSNSTVVEGHPMSEPARTLLKEVLRDSIMAGN